MTEDGQRQLIKQTGACKAARTLEVINTKKTAADTLMYGSFITWFDVCIEIAYISVQCENTFLSTSMLHFLLQLITNSCF